jgi:hypothetical protein
MFAGSKPVRAASLDNLMVTSSCFYFDFRPQSCFDSSTAHLRRESLCETLDGSHGFHLLRRDKEGMLHLSICSVVVLRM